MSEDKPQTQQHLLLLSKLCFFEPFDYQIINSQISKWLFVITLRDGYSLYISSPLGICPVQSVQPETESTLLIT